MFASAASLQNFQEGNQRKGFPTVSELCAQLFLKTVFLHKEEFYFVLFHRAF
jgi:hypothetical protein